MDDLDQYLFRAQSTLNLMKAARAYRQALDNANHTPSRRDPDETPEERERLNGMLEEAKTKLLDCARNF